MSTDARDGAVLQSSSSRFSPDTSARTVTGRSGRPGSSAVEVSYGFAVLSENVGTSPTFPSWSKQPYVREGNTVVVHSMDRLARNVDDLRQANS